MLKGTGAAMAALANDVATTRRVIDAEAQQGPVIVVGHSYGGAVISGAATGNGTVKALVYLAAFAPAADEPVAAFLEQYPSQLGAERLLPQSIFVGIAASCVRTMPAHG